MLSNFRTPFIALATAMVLLAVGGCGNRTKELLGSADKLYEAAKHATDQATTATRPGITKRSKPVIRSATPPSRASWI